MSFSIWGKISLTYYQLLFIFFLFSCENISSNKYILQSQNAEDRDKYIVNIDSIEIPIQSTFNTTYYTFSTCSYENKDFFVAYNPRFSSIDIIDISKRIPLKQLELRNDSTFFYDLDKQDLDKSRSITDIACINLDTIIINYSNEKIVILDTNMHKRKVIRMDSLPVKNRMLGRPISYSSNSRMLFSNKQLLLHLAYSIENWEQKYPVFIGLNINTEKVVYLPIAYSDYFYSVKGNVGFLNALLTSEYQKSGVFTYSYLYESNIYQYNPINNTIIYYGGTNSKGKNFADTISYHSDEDLKKWEIHNIENTQFFNVMYDKYRNVYYRFSLKNISYKNGKYFNTILDKPLILSIFNEKFKVIKEIELPKNIYASNTWFITKEGLFISPTSQKNNFVDTTHLRFHIIKLQKEHDNKKAP